MTLKFAVEPISTCWDEIGTLWRTHWPLSHDGKKGHELKLNRSRYAYYEEAGWFLYFTARDAENILRGYAGIYLTPSMHTQKLVATEDHWYLSPDARNGGAARLFYNFVEAEMVKRGATEITMTATDGVVGKMLDMLGYKSVSCYSKNLSKPTAS